MENAIVLLEDQIDYCQKAIAGVEPQIDTYKARIIELEEHKARWKRQLASYETVLAVLRKRA